MSRPYEPRELRDLGPRRDVDQVDWLRIRIPMFVLLEMLRGPEARRVRELLSRWHTSDWCTRGPVLDAAALETDDGAERSAEADDLDERLARTWVPRRTWHTVPPGPWPCEACGEYLHPASKATRRIVAGEPFYRHATCPRSAPSAELTEAQSAPLAHLLHPDDAQVHVSPEPGIGEAGAFS